MPKSDQFRIIFLVLLSIQIPLVGMTEVKEIVGGMGKLTIASAGGQDSGIGKSATEETKKPTIALTKEEAKLLEECSEDEKKLMAIVKERDNPKSLLFAIFWVLAEAKAKPTQFPHIKATVLAAAIKSFGIDVNKICDDDKNTALHCAARNSEAFKTLYFAGGDIMARDRGGRTALHMIAAEGLDSSIWTILGYVADIDARDNNDETPLHRAAEHGHGDICRILLENKAAVNARNKGRQTPLFKAVAGALEHVTTTGKISDDHLTICKILMEFGADSSLQDDRHATVFDHPNMLHEVRIILQKQEPGLLARAWSWVW